MAYAAVVSLARILDQLLHSDQYAVQYPKPQIESLYRKICFLQSSFEEIFPLSKSRSDVNDLEIRIRDVIYKAQDTIESFISKQILSAKSEEIPGDQMSTSRLLLDLQEIMAMLDPITEMVEKIGGSVGQSEEETQTGTLPSKSSSSSESNRIVGLEEDFRRLKAELLSEEEKLQVIPIVGMSGTGKTTLAKIIYNDLDIQKHFSVRAWVTISQEYHVGEILSELLTSMGSRNLGAREEDLQGSDERLAVHLYQSLFKKRYLIVMDDIWDLKVWDRVGRYLPDNKNGSRIIITSRHVMVARYINASGFYHVMHPLDMENSWALLCEKVFGGGPCPPELEHIGRRIVKNCGGIPLLILVVGGQLSRERKTLEYWESIAEHTSRAAVSGEDLYLEILSLFQKDMFINGAAAKGEDSNLEIVSPYDNDLLVHDAAAKGEESYSEILSLTYNNLPVELKGCFLYLGAFPKGREILISKLIKLWVAEGFLSPPSPPHQSLEQVAQQHLEDLIGRNLITVGKISSDGQAKTCIIQNNLQELAVKECERERFFHTINRYVQELSEGTESQRRISVHNNILMCTEDVHQCAKSIELARTLLYAGPNHHHPLPFHLTFELLRVLDALTVYFIELPNALFELIHLRYLAFTYDEDLPPSISKLRNLLILIVYQHPNIILRRTSILPVEIWNMPQIRHLLFTESILPDPSSAQNSVLLENLQSLSNINAASLTKEILQDMPNLKKLGIWIEAPGTVQFSLGQLQQLEALKFVVLKPIPWKAIDFQPKLALPMTLRKLSLSGCGLPWEDIEVIRQLPHLEVLKLRELAFQGPEWYVEEGERFRNLKFLLLESLDLAYWHADYSHFPRLERLIIRHCYELEEMDPKIGDIRSLTLIDLVDCNPAAMQCAREIRQKKKHKKDLQVHIYSSWD